MNKQLLQALNDLDKIGASIRLQAGALILTPDEIAVPESIKTVIKSNRQELVDYLAKEQRPVPDYIKFVSTKLECRDYPICVVPTTQATWIDDTSGSKPELRPLYRLTPAVYYKLGTAVESLLSSKNKIDKTDEISTLFSELTRYVHNHYRRDQLAYGSSNPGFPSVKPPPRF